MILKFFSSILQVRIRRSKICDNIDGLKGSLKLSSFKADQRPYRSSAANHVGAAVLAYVARSGRLDAAHR